MNFRTIVRNIILKKKNSLSLPTLYYHCNAGFNACERTAEKSFISPRARNGKTIIRHDIRVKYTRKCIVIILNRTPLYYNIYLNQYVYSARV